MRELLYFILLFYYLICNGPKLCSGDSLKLLILHNNDLHSRFEETEPNSDTCTHKNKSCVGGFARTAHEVRRYRKLADEGSLDGRSVLFLNAGDTLAGTAWFTVHGWKICADFLNVLQPDVVCLGNHEFDNDLSGLSQFVSSLECPVVTANVDEYNGTFFQNVKKSVILDVGEHKIGVVGYLTRDVRGDKNFGILLNITDEILAVREETEKLDAEGIKIIIALGHSGFQVDKAIAKNVPLIDLVVGGHSNTFLWNGPQIYEEKPEGSYPHIVKQDSGKIVPVVQAYAYTKYLGRLNVTFDKNGDLVEFQGQPEYLGFEVLQDKDVLDLLEKYRPGVETLNRQIIGQSKVYLDGSHCRYEECNFGNLVTDAFVDYALMNHTTGRDPGWSKYPAAFYNSGDFRNSINVGSTGGNVSRAELYGALPYENDLIGFSIIGKNLLETFEFSVRNNKSSRSGEFLQVSGIKVVYDMNKPSMNRVVSVKIRCGECDIPTYEVLDPYKLYSLVTSGYLITGGDMYDILKETAVNRFNFDLKTNEIVEKYIRRMSPVFPELEERITFL